MEFMWDQEPVQIRFLIRDPFLDGLPGWFDGLHGFDVALADGFGGGVPGDFLEGEWVTEEILAEAFSACGVVGGYSFSPVSPPPIPLASQSPSLMFGA